MRKILKEAGAERINKEAAGTEKSEGGRAGKAEGSDKRP